MKNKAKVSEKGHFYQNSLQEYRQGVNWNIVKIRLDVIRWTGSSRSLFYARSLLMKTPCTQDNNHMRDNSPSCSRLSQR